MIISSADDLEYYPAYYYSFGGNSIEAGYASRELTIEEIEYSVQIHNELYGLTPVAPPSSYYNCHSYAWCTEVYYGTKWVNPNGVLSYLSDGHTTQISSPSIGCIAVYATSDGEIQHSGVVASLDNGIYLYSKWGPSGLYYHDLLVVPYNYLGYGGSISYYIRDLNHDIIYDNITSTHHTERCSKCIACTHTSTHTFTYPGSLHSYHIAKCSECEYSTQQPHSWTYKTKSAAMHTKKCSDCNFSINEAHTFSFGENGYACVYCGQQGTLASSLPYDEPVVDTLLYEGK